MLKNSIILAITLVMIFSTTLVFAHSGGKAVVILTKAPPVIDGKDDWPKEVWDQARAAEMHIKPENTPKWFMFNETSPNRVSRGVIDNDKDFSLEFAFMFDDQWLYYIGVFTDDKVPENLNSGEFDKKTGPTEPHTEMWWLEFDYEHDAPVKPKGNDDRVLAANKDCLYQPGDHYYWLKPWTGAGTTKPACFENNGQNAVLGDRNLFDPECSANLAATRTATGLIIEGKLKFTTLFKQSQKPNLPSPKDGSVWGFDSTIEDHEKAGGREGAISWASSFENDNTTCIFSDLLFVGSLAVSPKDKLSVTWGSIKKHASQ